MRAEIAQRKLAGPGGVQEPAWVVTSEGLDPERTIFSGLNASQRATEYARARYDGIDFRINAETGHLGFRGAALGVMENGGV